MEAAQRTISEQKPAQPHDDRAENDILGLKHASQACAATMSVLLSYCCILTRRGGMKDTGLDVGLPQLHHCVVHVFHAAFRVGMRSFLILTIANMVLSMNGAHFYSLRMLCLQGNRPLWGATC
jgi:hypothetical protein